MNLVSVWDLAKLRSYCLFDEKASLKNEVVDLDAYDIVPVGLQTCRGDEYLFSDNRINAVMPVSQWDGFTVQSLWWPVRRPYYDVKAAAQAAGHGGWTRAGEMSSPAYEIVHTDRFGERGDFEYWHWSSNGERGVWLYTSIVGTLLL